ncbi:MAG: protein phosphatase 2C domain-containing protein [Planctomycetaceae bacterium]|jgi:serine/threonine protein phosphatase PrpC|nr:protein phosphatase 2C domain-containing protein [Planctomycetaceae bacterium]
MSTNTPNVSTTNGPAGNVVSKTPNQGPYIRLVFRKTDEDKSSKFLLDKIMERIKTFRLPSARVGLPFQYDFDFNIEGITLMNGKEHIENGNTVKETPRTAPKCDDVLEGNGFKLELNSNALRLDGTPVETFEEYKNMLGFVLYIEEDFYKRIAYQDAGNSSDMFTNMHRSVYISFNVYPNTRSLWEVKDANYGDYKNLDEDAKGETIKCLPAKQLEVIAASVRGRSHAHVAKPRDDAFRIEVDKKTGWTFVAVADGAGSAKYSRKGSELATNTVVETLQKLLTTEYNDTTLKQNDCIRNLRENPQNINAIEKSQLGSFFCNAVQEAWSAIEAEAKHKKATLRDYHTTLLCTAFKYLEDEKTFLFVSYWVGDGGVAILRPTISKRSLSSNEVFVLGEPDRGEYVNEAIFLTEEKEKTAEAIANRLRFVLTDSFEALILATDGITDAFFESGKEVTNESCWLNFYEKVLPDGSTGETESNPINLNDKKKSPQEKAELLKKWLAFWSIGNYDDRTILIVKPK